MGSKPNGNAPGLPMRRAERGAGWLVGFGLYWLAKRAAKRRDWHEYNHILSMLTVGNSSHDDGKHPCPFPAEFHKRPMNIAGAVYMPLSSGGQ